MNRKMIPLEIVGLKRDLRLILQTLRGLGCVQIDALSDSPQVSARPLSVDHETLRTQEEIRFVAARLDGLLETLGPAQTRSEVLPSFDTCLAEARSTLDQLLPKIQSLVAQRDQLQAELASLPRYETTLRKLLPILPGSAQAPGKVTVGILVSRVHVGILDSIGKYVQDLTGGQAEVVATDVDALTRAMLIVFSTEFTEQIEAFLAREDVSQLRLPTELGSGAPDVALEKLRKRMTIIPKEIEGIQRQLSGLATQWSAQFTLWRDVLRDELEMHSVLNCFGETDLTFVLVGWVPADDYERLVSTLRTVVGKTVLVDVFSLTPELMKRAPVALQNPPPARPFESLVKLLALPRYGHIDPTRLMALFLPIFFGMILGDVGYGTLLLLISLGLLFKVKAGVARDILTVIAISAGWTILFGLLFGELFGSVGESLGLHPLWFDRADSDHVAGLLIMTIGVGAIHITLGLILGVWEALRDRSRGHLLERGGMLLGLMGLFLLVGVLTEFLPPDLKTPAWAGILLGIVFLGASSGWLGILMGPIEFIGVIGNVLSYLRIAAIGLASVYLAKVANDVAGLTGNLIVGTILAVLIHALNLVLGAFSPTIHSLRLHYVEFFRKFYEGGGRAYTPFRSQLRTGN